MRNITNNNQLKIQETAFLDQLKINRRKLLNNKY